MIFWKRVVEKRVINRLGHLIFQKKFTQMIFRILINLNGSPSDWFPLNNHTHPRLLVFDTVIYMGADLIAPHTIFSRIHQTNISTNLIVNWLNSHCFSTGFSIIRFVLYWYSPLTASHMFCCTSTKKIKIHECNTIAKLPLSHSLCCTSCNFERGSHSIEWKKNLIVFQLKFLFCCCYYSWLVQMVCTHDR